TCSTMEPALQTGWSRYSHVLKHGEAMRKALALCPGLPHIAPSRCRLLVRCPHRSAAEEETLCTGHRGTAGTPQNELSGWSSRSPLDWPCASMPWPLYGLEPPTAVPLLGSIAETVVRIAPCPVFTVKATVHGLS